jgi:LysM repeat protein
MLSTKVAVLCAVFVAACEAQAPAPAVSSDTAPTALAEAPSSAAGAKPQQIVVEEGQSVSRVAAKYRVTKAAIIAANHLVPPYKIKTGQTLVIPGSSGPAPVAAREGRQIVIEEGRSISRIAAKYRVPASAIIAANHLTSPYKLKIGQHLLIPGPKEATAPIVVASRASEPIPLDEPAPHAPTGSAASVPSPAQPQAEASSGPTPGPVSPAPALPPLPVAAAPFPPPAPIAAEPIPQPLPVATAAPAPLPPIEVAPAPLAVAVAAAPPPAGATCPPGRTGAWSTDITRQPVYICQ